MPRTALVTGATGFVGSALVPRLLDAGWNVRVLARHPERLDAAWSGRVEVVTGDAGSASDLAVALKDADVAYYLLHSMDAGGDFAARDRTLATEFAAAARHARLGRIVYLGGLHPDGVPLSPHLASRVEVGEILLGSGVPTAVLQAGVVLGRDSASFLMLRHLTERLPEAVGPVWLASRIQPIALRDVLHYLVAAADLPPETSRTFDLGMDEVLTYAGMMRRYARVAGLVPRVVGTVPVLTPSLASHWVGLVTPVPASVAKPLVGSLVHDAVRHESDADAVLGPPPGGTLGIDDAVRDALDGTDPRHWGRTARRVGAGVAATALVGSLFTDPSSRWYARLRKPAWQPPPVAFPIAWTTLYALVWAASTATIHESIEGGQRRRADAFAAALAANLTLNAAWSGLFFRAHRLRVSTAAAAVLAASSADLARRAAPTGRGKALGLGLYAGWCAFATALTAAVARRNPT